MDNSASSNGNNVLKNEVQRDPLDSSSGSTWQYSPVTPLNIFWLKIVRQHEQFKDYNSGFRRQIQANNQEDNQDNGNNRPRQHYDSMEEGANRF